MRRFLLVATLLLVALAASASADEPSNNPAPVKPFEAPAVADPDGTIRKQMLADWAKPKRRKWRIDYRPISGMTNKSSWHIAGTHWWVRLNPQVYKLDELDKNAIYEIDAVALDQNYGVIDF